MSILIKGMEMPKEGCKDCLLVKRGQVFDICPFLKREVNGNVERGGKPYGCPLVPVPPHGRLIDADALSAKLNMMLTMAFSEGNTAFHFAYRSLGKVVENAPNIIPAEEGE